MPLNAKGSVIGFGLDILKDKNGSPVLVYMCWIFYVGFGIGICLWKLIWVNSYKVKPEHINLKKSSILKKIST